MDVHGVSTTSSIDVQLCLHRQQNGRAGCLFFLKIYWALKGKPTFFNFYDTLNIYTYVRITGWTRQDKIRAHFFIKLRTFFLVNREGDLKKVVGNEN
jgi:hypothetical protein